MAIVGRPNVGKSTLFNRLIGDERSIVHDMPGTTRDTIDTVVETADGPVRFIDTAGMRRRGKEAEGAEYYSMVRALQAIDRATLALLVIDANEGVTRQDQRLAERVDAAGNPVVVVLNKWDLLGTEAKDKVRAQVADMLGFVSYAPAWRSAPGRGGACTGFTRPWPRRSRRTGGGCRRRRSTGRWRPPRPPTRPRTGPGSCTPPRGLPTRPRSPSSPRSSCRRAISATWSARSGSASVSGRRPLKLQDRAGGPS